MRRYASSGAFCFRKTRVCKQQVRPSTERGKILPPSCVTGVEHASPAMLDVKRIGGNGMRHAVQCDGNIADAGAQIILRNGYIVDARSSKQAIFFLGRIRCDDGKRHGNIASSGIVLLQRITQNEKIAHMVAVQVR